VISASGLFSTAKTPNIDGAGTFKGRTFHTTAWDEDYDLNGKRIAVIGNGSTGVQLLAGIAEKAAFVSVFQRTPNWIAPLEGYGEHIPETARWMINNFPLYANWLGYANWFITLQLEGVQDYDSKWQESGGKISERNDRLRTTLESYISSKLVGRTELINKLIPKWAPLGRRLAVDNGWYDALKRENVELVTDRIVRMTPSGILTSDGREHNLDLIVFATGFAVARYFFPVQYVGRNGATLDKLWETDGPRAYLGLVLPGFPNLFTFYGPNGQPRAVSFYSWAEIWARYALKAITSVIEAGKTSIECRQDVFERYNTRMDAGSRTSIWEREGKGGYYVTEKGRSLVNMPWRSVDYHAMVVAPRMQDFVLR
jgi:4-hydroxyacetophenone monooxygenase